MTGDAIPRNKPMIRRPSAMRRPRMLKASDAVDPLPKPTNRAVFYLRCCGVGGGRLQAIELEGCRRHRDLL